MVYIVSTCCRPLLQLFNLTSLRHHNVTILHVGMRLELPCTVVELPLEVLVSCIKNW